MKIPKYPKLNRLTAIIVFALWPLISIAMDSGEYLEDAQSYFDKGEYSTAVVQLKNALLVDPDNGQARLLLGQVYLKLEDGHSAHKELRRAQKLGVNREVVLEPLGRALLMSGKSDELLNFLFIEADDQMPLKVIILVLQAQAHLAKQHYQLADDKFSKALELDPASVEALLGKARIAYHHKDNARVSELVDRVLSLEPNNADAWTLKGGLLRAAGQPQDAISAFGKALDVAPGNVVARVGKVSTLIFLGDLDKALEDINRLQEEYPNLYLAHYLKAMVFFQDLQLVPAQESAQLALQQAPNHLPSHLVAGAIAYRQGQLNQAEGHLRIYFSQVPDNPQATKLLAATLMKLKEPAQAVEVMEPGVLSAADDAQYLALLGSAYLATGDAPRGLEYMEKAVALAPDVAAIRTQLAVGRLTHGDMEQAITELQGVVELGEELIEADVLLVMAYMQNQEYDNALKSIEALSAKMPGSPLPDNLRGGTYFRMDDRVSARHAYEAALKIDPDFLPTHFNLAQLDREAGDVKAAETRYRKVLSIDEGNLKALLALSLLAADDGRTEETEKLLKQAYTRHPEVLNAGLLLARHYLQHDEAQKALDLAMRMQVAHPRNANVLDLLSIAQLNAGKSKEALVTMKKLAEVEPDSYEVHYQLAKVQLLQKQTDAARKSLESAIELQKDYPEAQLALGRLDIVGKNYDAATAIANGLKQAHPDAFFGYELEGDILYSRQEFRQATGAYALATEKASSALLAKKLFQSRLQAGEQDAAYEALRQWLSEHPKDTRLRTTLAMELQSAGQQQSAIEEYLKVLEYDADNVTVLNNLAWLYQEAGNPEGVKYAERAHEAAPDRLEVTDTLGWLLVQNGDTNRGLLLLQEAAVKAPHIPEIRYHMAVALAKAGRRDESRKVLDRLLKTGRNFQGVDEARKLREQLGG